MGKTKLLSLTWILALLAVAQTSLNGKEERTSFQGIVETQEVIINSEEPVEIWNIDVVPGQAIKKGRVLVELERPELTMKINAISHQLDELKSQHLVNRDEIRSQITQRKAEQSSITSEIDHKIEQIQSRYQFNKEMVEGFKSISKTSGNSRMPGAIAVEIDNLKKERQLTLKRFKAEIDDMKSKLASSDNPEIIHQEGLQRELELLYKEKKALLILSPIDGLISAIHCKNGEKVSPFEPILTLHTQSPSYVRGYIHEDIHTLASVGESVCVVAVTGKMRSAEGKIVGVGSRIVEYPLRLKKRPDAPLWGREVEISLLQTNPFLMGEKVVIQRAIHNESNYMASIKRWLNLETYAAESEVGANSDEEAIQTVTASAKIDSSSPQIEVSGLIYLDDLEKYLVISDETRDKKSLLYLMDDQARVTDELPIEGLDKIDDMEAICQDESGIIYIACSQSQKKNGKVTDDRKLFVQVRRSGTRLTSDRSVLLYDLLKDAAQKNRGEAWAEFIGSSSADKRDIEIEGLFVYQNALFLGFKQPLNERQAVILKIDNFHKMLDTNHLDKKQIQIWRELDLPEGKSGQPARISDLCIHKDQLLVLSCTKQKKNKEFADESGALTVFDFNGGELIKTHNFKTSNPEGIAFDSNRNCFVVAFDEGSDLPSKVMSLNAI